MGSFLTDIVDSVYNVVAVTASCIQLKMWRAIQLHAFCLSVSPLHADIVLEQIVMLSVLRVSLGTVVF